MKNITIIIIAFILCSITLSAQQIGHASQFTETRAFWNPAATAPNTFMTADAFFRQQWAGFTGAPRTTYISMMYPVVDMNMSLGGFIFNDKSGPVGQTGIKLNYAYNLKDFLMDDAVLSLGISASFQQLSFNGTNQIFNDGNDGLITNARNSSLFPSMGGGLYFNTHPEDYDRGANSLYLGLAYNHAYTTDVIVGELNYERQRHVHVMVGGKIMGYDSYIEPSFTANYVGPNIINYMMAVKFEKEETFWAGIGYSSVSDIGLQGGWIINRFLDNRYAKLRVGALANYAGTQFASDQGPGFELFVRYEVDID